LAIIATMNYAWQSRSSDSTTTSTVALKRILAAAQQRNVLLEQVDILNKRIENYQDIIKNLNEKDSATVEGYKLEIKTMNEQQDILADQVNAYEKLLRKERRKRWWTAAGGLVSSGALIYLYITK